MPNKNVKVAEMERIAGTSPTLPKTQAPIKVLPKPKTGADAELPVQQPGAGAPVQTMNAQSTQQPVTTNNDDQQSAAANPYTSINQQIWGDGGTGYEAYQKQLEKEMLVQQQTGNGSNAHSDDDLIQKLIAAGIDPNLLDKYSHKGGYTQYHYDGKPREVAAGTSGADEEFMSDGAYTYIQYCKEMYAKATTAEDKAYWHNEAEKTRARAGYSGGTDGSMHIPLAQLGIGYGEGDSLQGQLEYTGSGTGNSAGNTTASYLRDLLAQLKTAAQKQADGQIDYAMQQAIRNLERALEDAQPQFKEQMESVAYDELVARDNAALYAELRGDKGGIGQAQYTSIMNTAAQNRLAVQQAQTKLSTDTARQIEDLRAQGEFEKADKALEITQQYLSQLIGLEQWAAEFGLSQQQFQASLKQWEAEYNMSMQQLQIGQNRWEQEFAFNQQQYQDSLAQNSQSQKADVAWALLQAGVALDSDQLKALGISADQANSVLLQAQISQKNNSDSDSQTGIGSSPGYNDVASNAKKKGSANLTDKYLGSMVESGVITLDEADWIFRVLCGYSYGQVSDTTGTGNNLSLKTDPVHYGSGEYRPVQMN